MYINKVLSLFCNDIRFFINLRLTYYLYHVKINKDRGCGKDKYHVPRVVRNTLKYAFPR